ncbi:hypothetical protein [Ferrovum myxofaciens]|uniref:hypothetical protein n=1 Tax=Ferrovum myxofaciens TaxID=416213 RepID=UPI002352DABC|nr:hypothetical protein [Ferrovum myxofaciens]MBU6994221.1 hypothetical protein [Ferrovum myxofaciens]
MMSSSSTTGCGPGLALGTCNRCLILLRYAMNLAVRWEIPGITANPTKDVPLFEDLAGKKERFLTEEEAQKLYGNGVPE